MSNIIRPIGFLSTATHSARDAEREHFISTVLHLPLAAMAYYVSERLTALFPHRALLETSDSDFNLAEYARAGHCALAHRPVPHSHRTVYWHGIERRIEELAQNTWLDVSWQGHDLEVLLLQLGDQQHSYILAEDMEVARRFFATVCGWEARVHDEVLVFSRGHWAKDDRLFASIKGAQLDNLVLRPGLKEEIQGDAARFFAARETYKTYGLPWKRGLLFAGPPGNGKTHAVKALVNALGKPCLYVKSFKDRGSPDEYGMQAVFEQARDTGPCVLVLEDLDALVTDKNRSFFLNEMDGFAANGGILTLATSNHPARLDPAIVDRPSRFDRKYPFDLPAVEERRAYIAQWNRSLRPALRLSDAAVTAIAERTDDFSFAYLKELFISSMMRWISTRQHGAMDEVMGGQVDVLRAQMVSAVTSYELQPEDDPHAFPMHRSMRYGPGHGGMIFGPADEQEIPL